MAFGVISASREPGMAAYEVMTSESQERMLAIVTPADLERVQEVCRRWEVRAAVVGRVTEAPPGEPKDPDLYVCVQGALMGANFPTSHAGIITVTRSFEEQAVYK